MGEPAPRSRSSLTPRHQLSSSYLQRRQTHHCWLAQADGKSRQRKPQSKVILLRGMLHDGSWGDRSLFSSAQMSVLSIQPQSAESILTASHHSPAQAQQVLNAASLMLESRKDRGEMDPPVPCKATEPHLCSPAGFLLWHLAFAPSLNTVGQAFACPGFFPGGWCV